LYVQRTAAVDRIGAGLEIVGRGGKGNRSAACDHPENGNAAWHLIQAEAHEEEVKFDEPIILPNRERLLRLPAVPPQDGSFAESGRTKELQLVTFKSGAAHSQSQTAAAPVQLYA
jgi:hypothetical protein